MASDNTVTTPMTAAERARAFRRRRRDRMRLLSIEVREQEIDAMVGAGLLRPDQRKDTYAVIAALYAVLDRAFAVLKRGVLPELKSALGAPGPP
jgi:hypothetical protein